MLRDAMRSHETISAESPSNIPHPLVLGEEAVRVVDHNGLGPVAGRQLRVRLLVGEERDAKEDVGLLLVRR